MLDTHRARRLTLPTLFTALLLATSALAQDTCDVVVTLEDAGPFDVFAYSFDYSGAGGEIIGSGLTPACTELAGEYSDLYDDDTAQVLSHFVADQAGVGGPQAILSCVLALESGFPCPAASAFTVGDHAFPPLSGVDPDELFPNLSPPPAMSVAVSPRTPACGDGLQEGLEECDDGNALDGDCCSSTCTLVAAGVACSDADVCTVGETCDGAGTCVPASALSCDDGDLCTYDTCDAVLGCSSDSVPAPSGCSWQPKAKITLRDRDTVGKDKLRWVFRGSIHAEEEIGDPTIDADYALCVYDEVGGTPMLAARLDVPAGAGWQALGGAGSRFLYSDAAGASDGVTQLGAGARNHDAKAKLKAGGASLLLPGAFDADRYFAQESAVTVQLHSSAGACLEVSFDAADAATNGPTGFKAKAR